MAGRETSEASRIAQLMPDRRKREALEALSEDDFRDKVIRPLYKRLGLIHLRETCGADELGRDCLFVGRDCMNAPIVYAIQTKRGSVTMAGTNPPNNLVEILTQLRMALEAPVILEDNVTELRPLQVHLCASGKISNSARTHLKSKLSGHQIKLLGCDELIEQLDKCFPEYWLGIDAERFPYVRALRRRLSTAEDVIKIPQIASSVEAGSPVSDENYMSLHLTRMELKQTVTSKSMPIRGNERLRRTQKGLAPKFVDIPFGGIIDSHHRLVLVTGEGGSGKTTALRRLAITLVDKVLSGDNCAPIPIVFKARAISATKEPLLELMAQEAIQVSTKSSPFGADDLKNGLVAVFVDGLEEVNQQGRQSVIDRILKFHVDYPKCQVVVTSRDYRSILDLNNIIGFMHYRVLPLALHEADGLITRVVEERACDRELVKSTLRKLQEAHGLLLSPMLVTVFLASSDFSKSDLPPNISEIFRKFTELMIGRWDEKKGLHQQYEANTKDFLLRQLAYHMHHERKRSINIDELRTMIKGELARRDLPIDADDVFDEIVHRSGLLRTDGDAVEWKHHLFQEYFAGRGVPDGKFFASCVSDEWWRNAMMFHFGDKPEAFDVLWEIVESCRVLTSAQLFDAAVSIGLSIQACYLAEARQKQRTLEWVITAFGQSMEEFRKALDSKLGAELGMVSLCTMIGLGRDALASRTMKSVSSTLADRAFDDFDLFYSVDPERVEMWRLIGLLESGELEQACEGLRRFKTEDRTLLFVLFLSVAWTLHCQDPDRDVAKRLKQFQGATGPLVEDFKVKLFQELKSLFFQIRSGQVVAIPAEGESASDEDTDVAVVSTFVSDQTDIAHSKSGIDGGP